MSDICQDILVKAKLCIGVELAPLSEDLLYEMCLAAHGELFSRLRDDIAVSEIQEQYERAAAILAVSMFLGLEPEKVESFTAGNVTIRHRSEKDAIERAGALRAQAELLLLGYLKERDFGFRAVKG